MNKMEFLIISHYDGLRNDSKVVKLESDTKLSALLEYIESNDEVKSFVHVIVDSFKLGSIDELTAFNTLKWVLNPYGYNIFNVFSEKDLTLNSKEVYYVFDQDNNLIYSTDEDIDPIEYEKFLRLLMEKAGISSSELESFVSKSLARVDLLDIYVLSNLQVINYLLDNNGFRSFIN
jgi:hypothetical protein